jgi:hypothetical protein
MKSLLLVTAGLALGLTIGWLLKPTPEVNSSHSQLRSSRTVTAKNPRENHEIGLENFTPGANTRETFQRLTTHLDRTSLADMTALEKTIRGHAWVDGNDRIMALNLLYQRWFELSPESAIEAALSNRDWNRDNLIKTVFRELARNDPAHAWEVATKVKNSLSRTSAIRSTLEAIA